jgi:hypothetical protein
MDVLQTPALLLRHRAGYQPVLILGYELFRTGNTASIVPNEAKKSYLCHKKTPQFAGFFNDNQKVVGK